MSQRRTRPGRPHRRSLVVAAGVAAGAAALAPATAAAQATPSPEPAPLKASGSLYGGVGLLEMRNARFRPDGTFEAGGSSADPHGRYFLMFQALPWLEFTGRYTVFRDLARNGADDFDRSFDIKVRLLEETSSRPALAVGLQDFLGTGLFSGEYVVASKRWHALDFTAGLGWGRLAQNGTLDNPLASLGLDNRGGVIGGGGVPSLRNWFRGEEMSVFGGVEWFTPLRGLSVKAEFSSDGLREERRRGFTGDSDLPVNVGVNYQYSDWLDLGLGWLHGNTLMGRVSLRFQPQTAKVPKLLDEPPVQVPARPRAAPDEARAVAVGGPRPADGPVGPGFTDTAGVAAGDVVSALHAAGLEVVEVAAADGRITIVTANDPLTAAPERLVRAAEDAWLVFGEGDEVCFRRAGAADGCALAIAVDRQAGALADSGLLPRVVSGRMPRQPLVDALFDRLEAGGARTLGISTRGRAFHVLLDTAPGNLPPAILADAADLARQLAEEGIDQVVFDSPAGGRLEVAVAAPEPAAPRLAGTGTASAAAGRDTPPAALPRAEAEQVAAGAFAVLEEQGITAAALTLTPPRAKLYITSSRYRTLAQEVGRAGKVLAATLPPSIEALTIVRVANGMPSVEATLMRRHVEALANGRMTIDEVARQMVLTTPTEDGPGPHAVYSKKGFSALTWGLMPKLRQSFMDPDDPYRYGVQLELRGDWQPARHWVLGATLGQTVFGTLDEIKRASDSKLPHVRSDFAQYLDDPGPQLFRLEVNRFATLAPNVFARASAGIFEQMFGGVGGEVLYRPLDTRWAVGVDVNHVWQRASDSVFGWRDYNVTTGHASLYYDLPWYDLHTQIDLGRYLAGDWGGTFTLSRRFPNGMEIGGYFTLTDVPFSTFGEGSFDKGIFVSIPLDTILPFSTPSRASLPIQALTRDGGQKLGKVHRLYEVLGDDNRTRVLESIEAIDE